jgi:YD repeat-containing protein
LKGINSSNLSPATDIGKDGSASSVVARDVLGFALHYYDAVENGNTWKDYKTIGTPSVFAPPVAASNLVSLYNGNIGAMSVNNAGLLKGAAATTNALPLFYNYRYDQLNRIVTMQVYKGLNTATNQWAPVSITDYNENITYDPNGNILTYNRKGSPSIAGKQLEMDNLTYNYLVNSNKLRHITDPTPVANYTEDIDGQLVDNYTYDAIGNLKKDIKEGIGTPTTDGIFWNVYGKITSIIKGAVTITYTYDAAGNRITKSVSGGKTTLYVRDASGNVMSVYDAPAGTTTLKQIETHLYGSSRLGIAGELTVAPSPVTLSAGFSAATLTHIAAKTPIFIKFRMFFEG